MYYWGKAAGRFQLGKEAQSCSSRDAGSRLGHGERGSNQYPPPPSQKFFSSLLLIFRAEKRLYPHCSS